MPFVFPRQLLALAVALSPVAVSAATDELPELNVTATAEPAYQPVVARSATKTDAPLRDIPQTVNVVPAAVIQDQRATSLEQVLRNVPGVAASNGDGQRDQAVIRGFTAIGDQYVDGFRDDALYFRDLSNVESVEVIKGPAAVLYGRGSSGGLINRVSKQPLFRDQNSLTLSGGSWDQGRFELDTNQVLGERTAGRLTGAIERSNGFRDHYFLEREALAPSLAVKLGEGRRLTAGADWLRDRRTTDFGVPAYQGRPVPVSPSTYYGSPEAETDDYTESRVGSAYAKLEWALSAGWTLRDMVRVYDYDLDRNNTLPKAGSVAVRNGVLSMERNRSSVQRQEQGIANQFELVQKATTGTVAHELLYGLELARQNKDNQNYGGTAGIVAVFNPVLTRPTVLRGAKTADTTGSYTTKALYAQDLLTLSPQWKALLGLRYDDYRQELDDQMPGKPDLQRTDKEFSPRAGLVFQPDSVQSYYLSWNKSFQPSGEMFGLAANNAALEPELTTNTELGSKWDFLDGNLSLSTSVFRLERTNIKTPQDPGNSNSPVINAGEQRTDGVELTVSGRLGEDWQVYAGYAWLDGEITKSNSKTNGVPNQGRTPTLTPEHSANLWLTYQLNPSWRVGGGVFHVGERYTALDNKTVMPDYTTADLGVYYDSKAWSASVLVKNVADATYYASAHGSADLITPGAPRSLQASLTHRF